MVTFEQLTTAVKEMRQMQKDYFRVASLGFVEHKKQFLIQSKECEKKVDDMLKEIENQKLSKQSDLWQNNY